MHKGNNGERDYIKFDHRRAFPGENARDGKPRGARGAAGFATMQQTKGQQPYNKCVCANYAAQEEFVSLI